MKIIMKYHLALLVIIISVLASCTKDGVPEKGRTIFVRTQGADLPIYLHGNDNQDVIILLLHGGPGGNGLEYRNGRYSELLEEKYIMAYLDQRGQGASRNVNGKFEITMAAMIRDLQDVVTALKAEFGVDKKVYLLGHSWGGTLGTAYLLARDNQKMIQGWIEVDGAHDIPMLNREAIDMFKRVGNHEIEKNNHVREWNKIVARIDKVDIDSISPDDGQQINEYGYDAEELIHEVKNGQYVRRKFFNPVDPIISEMTGTSTYTSLLYDGIENVSLTTRLSELKLPSLLLWGKYDFVVPPALGHSAIELLGSEEKTIKIFEYSGHSPMNTEPIMFAETIIDFVDRTK
jgi:pimeloyl-ACP methyl ester carboxylesterase